MSKKSLAILAHPDLAGSQINAAWRSKLEGASDPITIRETYRRYPDRTIEVAAEQTFLESHERIFLQFPVYWYSAPPLLKIWLDDVLAYKWTYGPAGGRLTHEEIGLVVSTGSPEAAYQTEGRLGHTLVELLRPLEQKVCYVMAFSRPDITPRLRSMGKPRSRFTTFVMSTPISE